jgi:hypothetical protein
VIPSIKFDMFISKMKAQIATYAHTPMSTYIKPWGSPFHFYKDDANLKYD